jgi:hypothetical protein
MAEVDATIFRHLRENVKVRDLTDYQAWVNVSCLYNLPDKLPLTLTQCMHL